jgi:hypothetical protein
MSKADNLRRANSAGKIPVRLTLAQTSLSSAIPPQPQHILLSRQTFLHIGLESAVRNLHEYALPTLSFQFGNNNNNSSSGKAPGKTIVVVQEDDDESATNEEAGGASENISKSNNSSNVDEKGVENINSSSRGSSDDDGENDDDRSSVGLESKEPPPYPVCWFEDVATEQPLRWQYFAGVLFDSLQEQHLHHHQQQQQQQSHPKEDPNSSESGNDKLDTTSSSSSPQILPWEIRLHFQSYPAQKLLELGQSLGVLETVRMAFQNSLKQGFVIRYGNSKEALNLSKFSHDAIWEGISTNNYDQIAPVVYRDDEFDATTTKTTAANSTSTKGGDSVEKPEIIPNNEKEETKQQNDDAYGSDDTEKCKKDETSESIALDDSTTKETTEAEEETVVTTNLAGDESSGNRNQNNSIINNNNNLVMVPVRLSIDPTKPMIQKRCDGGSNISKATLGSLLLEWMPAHFEQQRMQNIDIKNIVETNAVSKKSNTTTTDKNDTVDETSDSNHPDSSVSSDQRGEIIRPRGRHITWRIAGLTPPLSTPLLDLWLALRHPDNFLYISLSVERR